METIEANNSNNAVGCLRLALTDWLKLNYNYERNGKPSWRKLARAIKSLSGNIFEKIASEHPGIIES